MSKKLVYGVGTNDADYVVSPKIGGKQVACSFYLTWKSMLERCYREAYLKKRPSYAECTVCDEWLIFSNFKKWMEVQDWKGKHLDKDILIVGNKVYSPETCLFVTPIVNSFVTSRDAARGDWPIGVCFHKRDKKFLSACNSPFLKIQQQIGRFDTPHEAHLAWKKRKHELALQLADLQTDERVAQSLRVRYL